MDFLHTLILVQMILRFVMKVGDLVKAKPITYKAMIPPVSAPKAVCGIVTKVTTGELVYVYWGDGESRPIHIVLLEKVK